MINRLILLCAVATLAASCGSSGDSTTVTVTTGAAPTTTTTAPSTTMTVTVYKVVEGSLFPRSVRVPRTQAVARAALGALGYAADVTVADGTATVDLPKATQDEQAEIVYTLTQYPSIQRVDVAGRTGLTRDDFASYLAPIFVETPVSGTDVPTMFHVSGSASVFEATLVVRLLRDGKELEKRTVTASEGAPSRGTFDATFTATPGPLQVQVFSPSAVNGAPQHEVDVEVRVRP
jgi:Immunoglobulin-like domain of bacterial spore germination/Sporulation and spore germination